MNGLGGGHATDSVGWEKMNSPGVLGGVDPTTSCGSMASIQTSGIFPSTPQSGSTLTIRLAYSIFTE